MCGLLRTSCVLRPVNACGSVAELAAGDMQAASDYRVALNINETTQSIGQENLQRSNVD